MPGQEYWYLQKIVSGCHPKMVFWLGFGLFEPVDTHKTPQITYELYWLHQLCPWGALSSPRAKVPIFPPQPAMAKIATKCGDIGQPHGHQGVWAVIGG